MSVNIQSATVITSFWTNFKSVTSNKNSLIQYDDDGTVYTIFAFDTSSLAYVCTIWKGTVPDPVIAGGYSQAQNDSDKSDFETNYKPNANQPIADTDDARRQLVEVNFRKPSIAATTYYILIDLNNSSGAYKHTSGTAIKAAGVHALVAKDTSSDQWIINVGTVLSINATQAVIGWVRFGNQNVVDTGVFQHEITLTTFPYLSNFTVSGGDYKYIADNFKETVTAINTSTSIEDISGGTYVPAVGDLILRPTLVTGTGTLLVHYHLWYLVE
jgi:hypothetical protein